MMEKLRYDAEFVAAQYWPNETFKFVKVCVTELPAKKKPATSKGRK
jgi:hypothetical protein